MSKGIITITLVAVLMVAALLAGCTTATSGKLVTEEEDFTDFNRVDVEGTFDVKITRSDSFSIIISADESFFDYIVVSQAGETLKISLHPRHTFTDFTSKSATLKAQITMPALYGLRLSGAAKVSVSGFNSPQDFITDLSGASSLDMKDIEVGDVEFEISGASKVTGNVQAGDARFLVSGASEVKLEGSANNIILNSSGASNIDLANFPLNNANVNLSGASEATLNLKGRLESILSGASSLYFRGNPTIGNISLSGASTIKHE